MKIFKLNTFLQCSVQCDFRVAQEELKRGNNAKIYLQFQVTYSCIAFYSTCVCVCVLFSLHPMYSSIIVYVYKTLISQSTINHSCAPNAEVAYPFNSHRCVVNTLRAVEPGEQILICYLSPGDMERSRHSRRKILRENYMFDCR